MLKASDVGAASALVSWWLVALPVFVLVGFDFSADAREAFGASFASVTAPPSGDEEAAERAAATVKFLCRGCCGGSFVALTAGLAAWKLSAAGALGGRAAAGPGATAAVGPHAALVVFAPIFAVAGCVLCCGAFVVCCAVDDVDTGGAGGGAVLYSPLVDPRGGGLASAERPPTPPLGQQPSASAPSPFERPAEEQWLRPPSRTSSPQPVGAQEGGAVRGGGNGGVEAELTGTRNSSPPAAAPTEKSPILNDID